MHSAQLGVEEGQTEIRDNLRNMTSVTARLAGRDLGSAMQEIQERLPKEVRVPAGTDIEYGGLYKIQRESFLMLTQVLLMSVVQVTRPNFTGSTSMGHNQTEAMESSRAPKLKFLHSESSLNRVKLDVFRRLSTDELKSSLAPGQQGSLKVRSDGTVLDGHHRLVVLIERGEDVHQLPREIMEREP